LLHALSRCYPVHPQPLRPTATASLAGRLRGACAKLAPEALPACFPHSQKPRIIELAFDLEKGRAVHDLQQQAALLALMNHTQQEWHTAATLIEEAGGALELIRGEWSQLDDTGIAIARELATQVTQQEIDDYLRQIQAWTQEGLHLVTVLDDDYPVNLREVYNRPPFLFIRGQLLPGDSRAIAVVGTRAASEEGTRQARQLAAELAHRRITVLSGMALGVDTAAHQGALDAGGRTLAILGTGIRRLYPPANRALAARILEHGAHVSQFWPDAPPTRYTFPMRNVVSSGIALGTVVIEAHGNSGAKMQARLCLEHGRRLFLVRSLVMHEEWAQRYASRPGVTVIETVDNVVEVVDTLLNPPAQLSLC
jgi:DNA processing protein